MSFQNITILGRVGSDAELRFTPTGAAVSGFSLASNETWKDANGQKQERTTWHRVSMWGKMAESLSEYITKGKMILVTGTVTARAYTDRSGELQASLEVKADQVRFAGGRNDDSSAASNGQHDTATGDREVENSEDIPF